MDEEQAIRAVKAGNVNAFEVLVDKYESVVYRLAYSHTRNREDAMDLAQNTFLKAFMYIRKFDEKRKFFSWIYSIMSNVVKDFYRKKTKRENLIDQNEDLEELLSESGNDMSVEDKMVLLDALDNLPSDDRLLLVLRHFEGMRVKEIAKMIGLGESNVKVKLSRARDKIRNIIDGEKNE